MPGITVSRNALYKRLGRSFTDDEFHTLCFEFGIELDEISLEDAAGKPLVDDALFKIDLPANRYDLLSLEGLARGLRTFLGAPLPAYRTVAPPQPVALHVAPSVAAVRPAVVAAVLRGVAFTQESYQSFIDLQEKLHQNICRKRSLVSIGTHDLDSVEGPFQYAALPPEEIKFVPLNRTETVDGHGMMALLDTDLHLRKYLPLIRSSPVYPVILDARGRVCSVPPIINSEHSKITLATRNVFIEVTATDRTKAGIVLDTITALFSEYCADAYAVEQVAVVADGATQLTPDFTPRRVSARVDYLRSAIGVPVDTARIPHWLARMGLPATLSADGAEVTVALPPTRSDVLHACDIMEGAPPLRCSPQTSPSASASARSSPPPRCRAQSPRDASSRSTKSGACPPSLAHCSDQLRQEVAMGGYTEVLTLSLCSTAENFDYLRKQDDGSAVKLSNPKTLEYQVARTSLLPGLLKAAASNRTVPLPLRLFETSDVVLRDTHSDVGAHNRRHLAALYSNTTAGFELLEIPRGPEGYTIEEDDDPTFFPRRCARVAVRGARVGVLGVLHPEVLAAFALTFPASALVLDLQAVLAL